MTLQDFTYETVTDPLDLPAGTYKLDVRAAGSDATSEPALSGSATVEADTNASVVEHLGADGSPMLSVFVNDTSTVAARDARLTVRHTAAAPAVDVLANDARLFTDLSNPNEQSADVAAGTPGTGYIVYAVGALDDSNLNVLVQTISNLGGAPAGVPSGTSGLAATSSSFPLWAIVLLSVAAIGIATSGVALARARR